MKIYTVSFLPIQYIQIDLNPLTNICFNFECQESPNEENDNLKTNISKLYVVSHEVKSIRRFKRKEI